MKNYLSALLILSATLIQSCTKDSNGNVTEVVPIPPVDLTATVVSDTQVDLSWTDKSTNESGFNIQRKTGTQTFADIGTTGKDVTIYSDQGLTAGTTYTYRVYSYNNTGNSPSYTNEVTVTINSIFNPNLTYGSVNDIDGNTYKTIQIGSQVWMAENLRTTKYRNNISIPNITDNTQWQNESTGAWSYYNNYATNNNPYGKLYNWYAVVNSNGICPNGWHLPTDAEWNILIANLDPSYNPTANSPQIQSSTAGGTMKSTGTQYWLSPNTDATNSSGFSGLPGGFRDYQGKFYGVGNSGAWWSSSTKYNSDAAWLRSLDYNVGNVMRGLNYKTVGFSVRCLRD
jgi:uncharacterized protein (TIGR02145 family)